MVRVYVRVARVIARVLAIDVLLVLVFMRTLNTVEKQNGMVMVVNVTRRSTCGMECVDTRTTSHVNRYMAAESVT